MTSASHSCPHCQASIDLPDRDAEKVQCPVCDQVFAAAAASDAQVLTQSFFPEPSVSDTTPPSEDTAGVDGESAGTLPADFFSAPAGSAAPTAQRFPGYEILDVLGRGGMGVVYKARQFKLNRIVALKTVISGALAKDEELARLRLEAEIIGRFQHPNIVQVFDVGEVDGVLYFSLEYVDGGTLADRLDGAPLPSRDTATLARSMADAIEYAHQQGIVHRDLKPTNILLRQRRTAAGDSTIAKVNDTSPGDSDGDNSATIRETPTARAFQTSPAASHSTDDVEPKITDFGLAKLLESDSGQTRSGAFMGTPSYAPPEQAQGDTRHVGPAADIYSLGAILYEMLTGRPPFRGETLMDTLDQVKNQEPVAPTMLNPGVSRDLETICLKCLRKAPGERYESAQAMSEDLDRYLKGEPILARPIGRVERVVKWCQRRPAIAGLISLAVVLMVVGTTVSTMFGIQASEKAMLAETNAEEARTAEGREREAKKNAQAKAQEARQAATQARIAESKQREAALRAKTAQAKAEKLATELQSELTKSQVLVYGSKIRHVDDLAHEGKIRDALELLLHTTDPKLRAWEARHVLRNAQRVIAVQTVDQSPVRATAASPAGDLWASAHNGGHIHLWRVAREQGALALQPERILKGHQGAVTCLLFNQDGSRLYSGSTDKTIRTWNLQTEKAVTLDGHEAAVTCLACTSIGQVLLSGSEDQSTRRWDLETNEELASRLHGTPVRCVAELSDDQWVSGGDDGVLRVWKADEAEVVKQLEGHSAAVTHLATNADATRLFSTGMDKTLRSWQVAAGIELTQRSFEASPCWLGTRHGSPVVCVGNTLHYGLSETSPSTVLTDDRHWPAVVAAAGSGRTPSRPNQELLAGYGDGALVLWDMAPLPNVSDFLLTTPLSNQPVQVGFSADGKHVALLRGEQAEIVDVTTEKVHKKLPPAMLEGVEVFAFQPQRNRLLTGHEGPRQRNITTAKIRVWDWSREKLVREVLAQGSSIRSLTFSDDGSRLITTSTDGIFALVLDAMSGAPLHHLTLGPPMTCGAFSRDGSLIASCFGSQNSGGLAAIFDGVNGSKRLEIQAHPTEVTHVLFNPRGDRLLTCGKENVIREWDVATGAPTRVFRGHAWHPSEMTFSHDDKLLITTGSGRDTTLRIWDYETGQQRAVFDALPDCVSLAVSPTGNAIAMMNAAGDARVFHDVVDEAQQVIRPRSGPVWAATWSPDGKHIALGGDDSQIHVWNPESGDMRQFVGSTSGIRTLAYHPDGTQLLSNNALQQMTIWDVASGNPATQMQGIENPPAGAQTLPKCFGESWYDNGGSVICWNYRSIMFRRLHDRRQGSIWDMGRLDVHGALPSPDGKYFAYWTGKPDGDAAPKTLCVVKPSPVSPPLFQITMRGGAENQRGVAFSADSSRVAVLSNRRIEIHEIAANRKIRTLDGTVSGGGGIDFSDDGKWIAASGLGCVVHLWDAQTGKLVHSFRGHSLEVKDVDFAPDSQRLLSCSEDGSVRVWSVPVAPKAPADDPASPEIVEQTAPEAELARSDEQRYQRVTVLAPSGNLRLVAGFNDVAWNNDGHLSATLPDLPGERGGATVMTLAASREKTAAICDNRGRVYWWDGKQKAVGLGDAMRLIGTHKNHVVSVKFAEDSQHIITASADRFARVWDLKTSASVGFEHSNVVLDADLHPNGQQLVTSASDGMLRIWSVKDQQLVRSWRVDVDGAGRVIYNFKGDLLATTTVADRNIKLWDPDTGELVRTLNEGEACMCVDFSADGRRIVAGDIQGVGHVWDVATGKLVAVLRGKAAPLIQIQFRPDGAAVDAVLMAHGNPPNEAFHRTIQTWTLK